MKYSLKTSFAKITLGLFFSILLLTILGGMVSVTNAASFCDGPIFCLPTQPLGYIKLTHVFLAGISLLILWFVWRKAWREQKHHKILLPLTTITTILFLGQSFVGTIQALRGYPLHLTVLHTLTAIALWISLLLLVYISGTLTEDGKVEIRFSFRQRLKDFYILSKPLIVALLLVTTYGGLVWVAKHSHRLHSHFGHCLVAH